MEIPKELLEQLTHGNCFACVGAGLSQGAGLPGWPQMLTRMIEWGAGHGVSLADRADLEAGIKSGKLLMVAEELNERMGKDKFSRFMKDLFRRPDLKPTGAHQFLHRIPFFAVITLNYDPLIESAYTLPGKITPPTFTHADTPELSGALRSKDFFILKAHGTIDRTETIILTQKDYRKLINSKPAYRQFLKNLFTQKTALFIGVGMTDPDLLLLLDELKADFSDYTGTHYALMDASQIPEYERKRFEKDYSIEIIPYQNPTGDHSEVKAFLKRLAEYDLLKKAAVRKIVEVGEVFDDDPDYRVVANTKGEFFIEAKHPGAAEARPLTLSTTLQFKEDTPEGKQAHEEFQKHLATGSDITIKGGNVREFVPPEIMRSILGDGIEPVELIIGARRDERPIPIQLEVEADDGERTSLDYVVLNLARHGNQEATFDNEPQAVPWKVSLRLSKQPRDGKIKSKINVEFNTVGVNAWQAFQQVKFARVMAKGGILRVRHLETNLVDETRILSGVHHAFEDRWFDLLERLVFIQETLKTPITVPETITYGDARVVFQTEEILKNGRLTGTGGPWSVDMTVEKAGNALEIFGDEKTQPITLAIQDLFQANILGTIVSLGPIMVRCPRAYINREELDKIRTSIGAAKSDEVLQVNISPFEGCPVEILFINWLPKEEREEALKHPGLRQAHPQLYEGKTENHSSKCQA